MGGVFQNGIFFCCTLNHVDNGQIKYFIGRGSRTEVTRHVKLVTDDLDMNCFNAVNSNLCHKILPAQENELKEVGLNLLILLILGSAIIMNFPL